MLDLLRDYIRPLQIVVLSFVLIVGALVSGLLELAWPGQGVAFTVGVAGWFRAIPTEFYALLGAGTLGYTAARTVEKVAAGKGETPVDDPDATGPDAPGGGERV